MPNPTTTRSVTFDFGVNATLIGKFLEVLKQMRGFKKKLKTESHNSNQKQTMFQPVQHALTFTGPDGDFGGCMKAICGLKTTTIGLICSNVFPSFYV